MEKRVLIAAVLSLLILLLWTKLFPPPEKEKVVPPPAQAVEESVDEDKSLKPPAELSGDREPDEGTSVEPAIAEESPVPDVPMVSEVRGQAGSMGVLTGERIILHLSSDGGKIDSFLLRHHEAGKGEPLALLPDGTLGLTVEGDEPLQTLLNTAPYRIETMGSEATLTFGNGKVWVQKVLSLEGSMLRCQIEVKGVDRRWGIVLGPGLRHLDESEAKSKFQTAAQFVAFSDNSLDKLLPKKIEEPMDYPLHGASFFGLDDRYFASIIFPDTPVDRLHLRTVEDEIEVSCYPDGNRFSSRLFIGGKTYNRIVTIDPALGTLVNFGWFSFIGKPMLWMLNWLYDHVKNYGFAIILLTVVIRILLYPLTHKQLKSMKGMQKLQPKIERLKSKYKKHKTDPDERAKMNQEMMELYRQEGVNPLGGCLPLLIQIPILWAFYNLLSAAIELRHAPFLLWIQDLSAPDPYLVTPILMGAAMLVQQLMTPTTGSASQRKMFLFMPIIFTFVFLGFPSGLVLYWLTNNIFQILQTSLYQRLEKKEA